MSWGERLRMKNLAENLQRLDDTRPRSIEELIAVSNEDLPFPHGPEPRPKRITGQSRQLLQGPRDIVAARHQQDRLGIGGREVVKLDPRRMRARRAEQIFTTGHR